MDEVTRLGPALAALVKDILVEYVEQQGGVLCDDARTLAPELVASPEGGLPALVFWASEFVSDYEIAFVAPDYRFAPGSYLGVAVPDLTSEYETLSAPLFVMSDFLRKELLPHVGQRFDLSGVFEAFRQWCLQSPEAIGPALPMRAEPKPLPQG